MSKKVNIGTLSLFLVIFLIGFRLSYKKSGKFRKSIRIAIIWAIVVTSLLSVEAKSNWFLGVDSFPPPAHSRPSNKNSGLFNQPKPQNQNPGFANGARNGTPFRSEASFG